MDVQEFAPFDTDLQPAVMETYGKDPDAARLQLMAQTLGQRNVNHSISGDRVRGQFPSIAAVPFPRLCRTIVATANNFQQEFKLPSGAQLMRITTSNGVYVARSAIQFPIGVPAGGIISDDYNDPIFCPLNAWYVCLNISTLTVGLLNAGDVASFQFYMQQVGDVDTVYPWNSEYDSAPIPPFVPSIDASVMMDVLNGQGIKTVGEARVATETIQAVSSGPNAPGGDQE